ncbi:protein yippee-like 2 [Penaeus vannamei]|uniref:protein yippee-like 2 n=1 Tax=Penaeus vannamei TaxID=6689 RepID=UPI00387FA8A9
MFLDAPAHGRATSSAGKGRVRVLECLAPWLCISAARPVGSVGSGAARQQQQQEGQQQQQPGEPGAGWLRDTRTAPSDRTRPHSAPVPITTTMVKTFQAYLPSCHRTYSCIHCRAHLANHDELISKSFQGSQGRAYLFNSVVNVGCGPAEERVLLTGLHAVADIYCECCKTTLGWKYEHAFESSQKYKEGKYIIELAHMIKDNGWD